MKVKPIIGITSGDPGGIGPEITVKSLALREIYEICRPLVISDGKVMEQAVGIAKKNLKIHGISDPGEGLGLNLER